MLNIVGKRKIFYVFSVVMIAASIFSIIFWGLHFGIDFRGGSLIEINFPESRPDANLVKEKLSALNIGDVFIQPTGDSGMLIRSKNIDEETHQQVLAQLNSLGSAEEIRFDSVGPTVGAELKNRALWAIVVVLILIIIYIAFAFRKVSRPVASWKYGVAAIIALFHDVFVPAGIFAILGHYFGVEIDLLFVTGILTILGFSVHDTIVIFDRIRENLRKGIGKSFDETVNISVNQTITRSINTSLTVFLTLMAIYLFGGESTRYFVLLLIMGIILGTYSSIFVASSLLVTWENWRQKKIAQKVGR